MIDLLRLLMRNRSGVFIDVGVNLGYTLIKAKIADPDVIYVGFEPNPACVFYTTELIRENGFRNCTLVPVGLFDVTKIAVLRTYGDARVDPAASVMEDFRPDEAVVSERHVPLFNFTSVRAALPQLDGQIGIVKIDVEGAELEVVSALRDFLQEKTPYVLIEVLPVYNEERRSRLERQIEIEKTVKGINYRIARVLKTPVGGYRSLELIESIGIHSDLDACDYVLIPPGAGIDEFAIT